MTDEHTVPDGEVTVVICTYYTDVALENGAPNSRITKCNVCSVATITSPQSIPMIESGEATIICPGCILDALGENDEPPKTTQAVRDEVMKRTGMTVESIGGGSTIEMAKKLKRDYEKRMMS